MQFECCRRYDANGSFGANEYLLEVEAGIVFAQLSETTPHSTIRQNHFQSQHIVTGGAVPQDAGTARVCSDLAANPTGSLSPKANAVKATMPLGMILHVRKNATSFSYKREIRWINRPNTIELGRVEHDPWAVAPFARDGSLAQAGIPALGHNASL
jgi:hypothetical protein